MAKHVIDLGKHYNEKEHSTTKKHDPFELVPFISGDEDFLDPCSICEIDETPVQYRGCKPAVTFSTNVYTGNGMFNCDDNVFSVFGAISNDTVGIAVDHINNKPGEVDRWMYDLMYRAQANGIDSVVGNYDVSINNCVMSHLVAIDSMFMVDGQSMLHLIDEDNSRFNNNICRRSVMVSQHWAILDAIQAFINARSSDERIKMINSYYLELSLNAFTNNYAMSVYEYIRFVLNNFFTAIAVKDKDTITAIMSKVAEEFSKMMLDLAYEESVFISNLISHCDESPLTPEIRESIDSRENNEKKAIPGNGLPF